VTTDPGRDAGGTTVPVSGAGRGRLFEADETATAALREIAEALFEERISFGQLLGTRTYEWATVDRYLSGRSNAVAPLLGLLEHACGLRFAPGGRRIPYCYNRADWSADAPLAGYSDEPDAPLPHQVLVSLIGNWRMNAADVPDASDPGDPDGDAGPNAAGGPGEAEDADTRQSPLYGRVLISALWTCYHRGLRPAIEMVLDLLGHGFFPSVLAVAEAVTLLAVGRAAAGSDQELVRKYLGGTVPQTQAQWLSADIDASWLGAAGLRGESAGLAVAAPDVASFLLEYTFAAVTRTRQARSLDEWLRGCAVLWPLISVVHGLLSSGEASLPVSVRAAFGQLEEVAADAFSVDNVVLTIDGWAGYAQLIGQMFRREFGDQWKEALYRERLIVPKALRARLLDLEGTAPPEWTVLSQRLVWPFLALNKPGTLPGDMRTSTFDADAVLADGRITSLLAAHGVEDAADQRLIIDTELHTDTMPMVSISYPWQETRDALAEVLVDLARRDVLDRVYPATGRRSQRRPAPLAGLAAALDLYPNNSAVLWEVAVATDRSGRPAEALPYLVQAIVLEPDEPGMWQSLGVVLDRLGHPAEARMAQAIGRYWKERAAGESPG
jgi:hypothetical protein